MKKFLVKIMGNNPKGALNGTTQRPSLSSSGCPNATSSINSKDHTKEINPNKPNKKTSITGLFGSKKPSQPVSNIKNQQETNNCVGDKENVIHAPHQSQLIAPPNVNIIISNGIKPSPLPQCPSETVLVPPIYGNICDDDVVIAKFAYTEIHADDLSIKKGEKLKVLDRSDPDWWKVERIVRINGVEESGYVPATYVVANDIESEE
jgi:hypothetical protein